MKQADKDSIVLSIQKLSVHTGDTVVVAIKKDTDAVRLDPLRNFLISLVEKVGAEIIFTSADVSIQVFKSPKLPGL